MMSIEGDGTFWKAGYGAYRWDKTLYSRPGTWFLVSLNYEFDYLRGVKSLHVTCVVDDFGNLVKVAS